MEVTTEASTAIDPTGVTMMSHYKFYDMYLQLYCITVSITPGSTRNTTCAQIASARSPYDYAFVSEGDSCRLCRRRDNSTISDWEHEHYGPMWRKPGERV